MTNETHEINFKFLCVENLLVDRVLHPRIFPSLLRNPRKRFNFTWSKVIDDTVEGLAGKVHVDAMTVGSDMIKMLFWTIKPSIDPKVGLVIIVHHL